MKGVTVSIDRIVIDFTDVYWGFFNEFHKHICHYFPEEYVDTHRLTLEVQTELNWSDELTKDVAQRIAKKQDYNLIVKEMKRKYGVDVLGGVAIIYTCYNAERDGVTLNELFWGNPIDIPTVKGGGFIGPSLGLKKPGLNNMNTEMPKETPKPPNPPNTSNKNPVFGADWNNYYKNKYGKDAVEWVSKGREELRTKVKTNVEQSAAVREASNFDVHLKKEKEILERIKNKGTPKAPNIDLSRIGTGAVGDFQNVKDVNDLISRIPADAKQIPWREVPGGAKEGIKFRWVDEAGKTWDVRAHSIDPSAPPGSNAANGWIYRVEVKQVNPKWKWTMDSNGNFHKENVLRENSPYYDESIANETHIPFTP